MNCDSSSTVTPSSLALVSFEPAPGPATTQVVLADTDPATFAPNASSRALPSSRLMVSSVPVSTPGLASQRQAFGGFPLAFPMHAELPQLGFDQTGALGVLGFVEVVAQERAAFSVRRST